MNLINRTTKPNDILADIMNIIISHTGIISDITVYYIADPKSAHKQAINVIMDIPGERRIQYFGKYFLINPRRTSSSGFSVEDDTFILDFDIFSMMETLLFDDLDFIEKHMFEYAFAERMMLLFRNCAKAMAEHNGLPLSIVSDSPRGYRGYFVPTFDIDRMNYINPLKTALYKVMECLQCEKAKTSQYRNIRKKTIKDPWYNIEEINDIMNRENLSGLFNFLTVRRDRYARRYSLKTAREAAGKLSKHSIGVHLTRESGGRHNQIRKQIRRSGSIYNNIKISRFHYLYEPKRSDFKVMEEMGIIIDTSSGFRERIGFKRGFNKPYRIPGTSITELPVICMDSAYMASKGNNLSQIVDEIRSMGGFFTFIFHQSALNEDTFPGYSAFLNEMLDIRRTEQLYNDDIFHMIEMFNSRIEEELEQYEYCN